MAFISAEDAALPSPTRKLILPHAAPWTVSFDHADACRARIAPGLFFLPGWVPARDWLASLERIQLLLDDPAVGPRPEDLICRLQAAGPAAKMLDRDAYAGRRKRQLRIEAAASTIGGFLAAMDQSDEAERLIDLLVDRLRSGRLRAKLSTRQRLSGRVQVYDASEPSADGPGFCVVGSSNPTLAGVGGSHDLDVCLRDRGTSGDPLTGSHAKIGAWFDRCWENADAFEEALLGELEACWARPAQPWDVYLKTIHTLVDARGAAGSDALLDDDITRSLADFQRAAVEQAIAMIHRHRGCFVSDVVGLGKSYVGAAILKHFGRVEGRRPLIVCPKALEAMWQRYDERYALNAAIVPMSVLLRGDRGLDLFDRFPDRGFVLIDESHSFRNAGSQRYEELSTWLQAGDRRVCLLTATPRNSRARDVYHQLRLFHPDDQTDLPISTPDLARFFHMAERGEARLGELLQHVMVRRTRRHVLRWWGTAADTGKPMLSLDDEEARPYLVGEKPCFLRVGGRENRFPVRRLRTLRYSIEAVYEGFYDTIRRKISDPTPEPGGSLTYARYDLRSYLREELRGEDRFAGLRRAGPSLRGLIRVMLFKRLESSVAAFRATVGRLAERHRLFLKALESGVVPTGEESDAVLSHAGVHDDHELLEQLRGVAQEHATADFDVDRLIAHVRGDADVLEGLLTAIGPIANGRDAKANTLLETLAEPTLAGRKVLVFTQFTDTAEHLGRVLNPSGIRSEVVIASGGAKNKARVVGRFAPKSNPAFAPKEGELETRILIATDAFSEGLNMQDCDVVINYDLHWNPVRLIQRLGRIDRIGSENAEIHALNFLPESGIEKNLGIVAVLRDRIAEIHATIGEDAQILDDQEQLNEESMFAIYNEDVSVIEDEEAAGDRLGLQEAGELLRKLRLEEPEEHARILALRDGIRTAKPSTISGTFTLCRDGDYLEARVAGPGGETLTTDPARVLALIEADRSNVAPAVMPSHHYERVARSLAAFADAAATRATGRRSGSRLGVAQRYAIDRLDECLLEDSDDPQPGRMRLLERMKSAFSQTLSPAVRRELQRLRTHGVAGRPLLVALQEIFAVHRLGLRGPASEPDGETPVLPRLICSADLKGAD